MILRMGIVGNEREEVVRTYSLIRISHYKPKVKGLRSQARFNERLRRP